MGKRLMYCGVSGVAGLLLTSWTVLGLTVVTAAQETGNKSFVSHGGVSNISDKISSIVDNRTSGTIEFSDNDNRTIDSVNNGYTIVEDSNPTDVPITGESIEVSRTTNSAENSDEKPTTVTTLIISDDNSEFLSDVDLVTSSVDGITTVDDVAVLNLSLDELTTLSEAEQELPTSTEQFPTLSEASGVLPTTPDELTTLTEAEGELSTPAIVELITLSEAEEKLPTPTIPDDSNTVITTTDSTINDESLKESLDLFTDASVATLNACIGMEDECNTVITDSQEQVNLIPTLPSADIKDSLSTQEVPKSSETDDSPLENLQTLNNDLENVGKISDDSAIDKEILTTQSSSIDNGLIIIPPNIEKGEIESTISSDMSETEDDQYTKVIKPVLNMDDEDKILFKDTELESNTDVNDDDYELVVETLISTATVYYDEESLQHLQTSRRVVRTVSQDFNYDATNQYRGFLSDDPLSVKNYMTINPGNAFEQRQKFQRKSEPEPDIDDIIKGIVQLLGGNVKVTAADEVDTRLTTFGNHHSSRINNRGPPRLTRLPVGGLNSAVLTRPPIRPPVTPPASIAPGRPQFVANTRPPFLAPLPPSLASRPSPPIQRPFATGVPLPLDLLPVPGENTETTPVIAINPVFPDYDGDEGSPTTETRPPSLEPSTSTKTIENSAANSDNLPIDSTKTMLTSSSQEQDFSDQTTLVTDNFASDSETPSSVIPGIATETSTKNDLEPSLIEATSALITPTPVSKGDSQQSSTMATDTVSSSQTSSLSMDNVNNEPSSLATPPLQLPSTTFTTQPSPVFQSTNTRYTSEVPRPRPGVVLDDSNYRPGQIITGTVVPFDTGRPGDIFDVTVSAYQDFGGGGSRPLARPPVNPNIGPPYGIPGNVEGPLITTPVGGDEGFVSIDGRKTYFDLFPTATQSESLAQDKTVGTGVGSVVPEDDVIQGSHGGFYQVKPVQQPSPRPLPTRPPTPPPNQSPSRPKSPARKPSFNRRPTQPPIRIDTCIVGDDSTCQEQLSEVCRTEEGVSSCYCKPGTARKRPRTPCKRMVVLSVSMKVDRIGDQRIVWSGNYVNPESEEYQLLEWESGLALSNAMSKTRLASSYLGNTIHKFYSLGGKVIVNSTVQLEDSTTTRNRNLPKMLQKQLIQVIQSHKNNIGDSALYVEGPLNPIPDISDVNECNDPTLYDCHPDASCINEFGTFTCRCLPGYTDRYSDDPEQVGRKCESCSSDHCNKRGDCRIENGHKVCECMGSYYGTRCEIDGEVLGVAVGASVAAVVIIILTLIFLCMWSRRWKAQDRKTEVLARGAAAAGATLGGYSVNIQHKGGTMPPSQYGVSMEDRMRWAQIADSMATQNLYTPQSQDVTGVNAVYSANSNEYLTSAATSNPYSVYNRVTRALSNSTLGRRGSRGFVDRFRDIFGRQTKSNNKSKNRIPPYMMTAYPTLNFQQLMALHAQLSATQSEQLQNTLGGPSVAPSVQATMFKNQRQMAASSSGYASLGTLGSTAVGPFNQQTQEQFGLQHLNPANHLASLQQQQQFQKQQQQQHQQAFGSQSTYGQYGPASFSAMSHSGFGVSRAPTLGARTPVPLHESMGGPATIGPMGGATVAAKSMMGPNSMVPNSMGIMESSEEEMDRPYHLPRPKSRGSLADGSDIYYEPDDLTLTSGPPDRPPPPIPHNNNPQTYNFSFLH